MLQSVTCWSVQADYTFKYSNSLDALSPGESVKVVMMRVLPGRSRHIKQRTPGLKPSDSVGFDSHSSSNFQEWYAIAIRVVLVRG